MNRRESLVSLLMLFLVVRFAAAETEPRVMTFVDGPTAGWIDGNLNSKLYDLFADADHFQAVPAEHSLSLAAWREEGLDSDHLIRVASQNGCRLALWCRVDREDLQSEKHFSLPFLLSQRRVSATLQVSYRVLDCIDQQVVESDRITLTRPGASALQYLDYGDADPGLYVSYQERKRLFDLLEEEAAKRIFSRLERITSQ
jgi:hypothetical protein